MADLYDNRDGWADRDGRRWHTEYPYPDGRKVWRSADKKFTPTRKHERHRRPYR